MKIVWSWVIKYIIKPQHASLFDSSIVAKLEGYVAVINFTESHLKMVVIDDNGDVQE